MDKKKIAAAMAAVTEYIKTGEAEACQNQGFDSRQTVNETAPRQNLWGISGRQELMQAGTCWTTWSKVIIVKLKLKAAIFLGAPWSPLKISASL